MAPTPPRPRPGTRPRSSGAATQAGLFDSAHAADAAPDSAPHTAQPTTSPAALARQFTELPADWHAVLAPFTASPICASLCDFVDGERAAGKTIYPTEVFRSLHLTRAQDVKVVILGQDPYHGDDHGRPQAHGLAFSVPPGVRPPPSLKNIFKEQAASLDLPIPSHGCLDAWARQGVLLLNTVLTVEAGLAASHAKHGWEPCTDTLLAELANRYDGLIFMLWGAHAQAKRPLLNPQRHTILEAPHPSPLSAHRGFLGCGHFLKANAALVAAGRTPIDWGLPASA